MAGAMTREATGANRSESHPLRYSGGEGEATAPQRLILVQNFFEEMKRLVPN